MNKQKIPTFFHGWLFFFLLLTWITCFPTPTRAAIVEPSFETLPIDQSMITTAGKAGTPSGSENHQYVQINDTTTSSSGAVWFNNPVTFTRDFKLDMAFYIENAENDSDGLTFVMQSNGPTSLAEETGSTIGVWANTGGTNPLSQGAIPNSVAIEFDTFYNNNSNIIVRDGMMDRDTSSKGHHIAWAYPGVDSSYTTDGIFIIDKVLHHQNEVGVQDLSDGQWHQFVVEFKKEESTFTYTVPDYNVNVTIPVDDTFKNNLGLNAGKSVYFGFTGANGGYAQSKAISFVDVQGLVDLQLRTGIFQKSNNQLLADTGEVQNAVKSIDREQVISYRTAVTYAQDSDLLSLQSGTIISLLVPSTLEVIDDTVYFSKTENSSSQPLPTDRESVSFTREADTLDVTLPELERGYIYEIYFEVKNNYVEEDNNLNLTIPVSTKFSGNAFAAPVVTGSPDTHFYNITGNWLPTVSNGYKTVAEAKNDAQIVRQNRKAYFPVQIEDENSTSVHLFTSALVSEEDLSSMTFSKETLISRNQLSDPLNTTIEYDTDDLLPGNVYYVGMYVIDAEGNQSETVYMAIDFKGVIELNTVPENFHGKNITINDLVKAQRADGYLYLKVDDLGSEPQLNITNTSEENWVLDGQLTDMAEQIGNWGEDLSLCFFEKGTENLAFQLSSEKQRIFAQQTAAEANLTKNFNDYDIYFKIKADPIKAIPGTYLGKVQWSLTNADS